jgi:maltodextrin utilization protein YvdJ
MEIKNYKEKLNIHIDTLITLCVIAIAVGLVGTDNFWNVFIGMGITSLCYILYYMYKLYK